MNDLIERLEKATGPDRALDGLIAAAVGVEHGPRETVHLESRSYSIFDEVAPRYTESIDAAMTLMPDGVWLDIGTGTQKAAPSYHWPVVTVGLQSDGSRIWRGQLKTIPLALCKAALQARAELTPDER